MTIKLIGTLFAGMAPALKASSPACAPAWAWNADAGSSQRRRRSLLWMAPLFMLCLTTFSANATSTQEQLGVEISSVETLLSSTAISANGWDIPLGTPWVSTESANALQLAITAARAGYDGPPQSDYDSYLIPLSNMKVAFGKALNPSGLKYDYTDLTAAIAAAEAAISPANFAVSDDGMNVPGTKKWTSQAGLDAFKLKIAAARQVIETYGNHGQNVTGATTNQSAIDNAAATLLYTQLPSFNNTLLSGYMPDYAELTTKIATAKNLLLTTAVSADGLNVSSSNNWTTQTAWDALNNAVTAAQTFVDDNAGATVTNVSTNQINVTAEDNTLNTAVATFNSSVSSGTGSNLLYNYLVLNAAIADAQDALASITGDATDGNNVAPDKLWADPSDWDALNTLVSAQTQGQTLEANFTLHTQFGNEAPNSSTRSTNQATIDAAASALQTATSDLRTNAFPGFKPDYTQLEAQIAAAQTILDNTPASVDGHEYASSDFWALSADRTTLQAAIDRAYAHVTTNDLATESNYIANQNAVDTAYSNLGAAHTIFLTQRKAGDAYDPTDTNFTDLPTQISSAEAILDSDNDGTEDVVSSASSGADVAFGTYWLAVYDYVPLTTQLGNARNIVNSPSSFTKTYISNTYTSLSAAVTAANPQNGRGANPAELDDEIAAAALLKAELDAGNVVISSSNGTNVVYGKKWVSPTVATTLTTTLAAAQSASVIVPPALHATEITPREFALRSAIDAFVPTRNTPDQALPDITVLTDACDSIFAIVNALAASANGGADVLSSATWVPAADKAALLADITAALLAPYATHEAVLDAIDALTVSLTVLQASQAPGSKPSYILATSQKLPNGFVGAAYNAQVVDAGLPNVSFSVTGALPDGLSLDASSTGTPTGTGKLAGKPTRAGTFTFTIQATHNTMIPAVTETLSHTVQIYDAPAIEPEYDMLVSELVSVYSDIVIRFPSGTPMNTTAGTVLLDNHPQAGGYWSTETTYIIPSPVRGYAYETNYTFAIVDFESKDGFLTYSNSYTFRTSNTPPYPNIPRSVTILPLSAGITSDLLPGQHWTGINENYSFTFTLTVPPDQIPTVTTNRIVNGEPETVTGVPDPDMPETRFQFTVRQIHQAIEIRVVLSPRTGVANESVGEGVRIWAADGKLYVETPQPGLLSVYHVTGVLQTRQPLAGNSTIPLPKGIYIVRLNGKVYKVVAP